MLLIYRTIWTTLFISAIILFSSSHAQTVFISSADPVNLEILDLINRGYLNDLTVAERPWLMNEVIRAIMSDMPVFDSSSRETAEFVLNYLGPPQKSLPDRLSGDFNLGLELRGLSRERRDGYFLRRARYVNRNFKGEIGSAYNAGWWISKDNNWGIDTRLIFDSDGTGYPWYYGRAHNARIIGQFDHAYAAFELGNFNILAGRQRIIWGPSSRGSLLIDNGSPPLDMISFRFDLKPFRLSWFTARIDDYYDPVRAENNRRYLAGHRFALNTGNSWELALSEVVLYGGPERLPEIYYGIPVVLFYWESFNRSLDDNTFWAIDGSWTKKGIGRFYGQLIADDFQYENNGPQRLGIQLGADLNPSRFSHWKALIELNAIDKYVYGHRKRVNVYYNWDRPIGRLDSDEYEIFASLTRRFAGNSRIGIQWASRGKGEYYAVDRQDGILPKIEKFPSGIVEITDDISLVSNFRILNNMETGCALGHQDITNYKHDKGRSFGQFYVNLYLSYRLDTGIPFWTKYR